MKYFQTTRMIFIGFTLLALFISCKKEALETDLASLQLLRGDLQLCGDGQFGNVRFSESCSFQTRETFDLAISLLHSFEYIEAEKAFVKVVYEDPDCAMAYWGVAMSIYYGLWAPPGEDVLEKGNKLLAAARDLPKSKQAAQYIEAIGAFYRDWENTDKPIRKEH